MFRNMAYVALVWRDPPQMCSWDNSVGKLHTLRAIQPTNRDFNSCRNKTFFAYPMWSNGCAAHAVHILWAPRAISERPANNLLPSTVRVKTKKAWSYTFSTYSYQTCCLVQYHMWNRRIYWSWTYLTYCVCYTAFKVKTWQLRETEVIIDKLNIGMCIWVVNSSQKQTEVVVVIVVVVVVVVEVVVKNANTRNFLSWSFLPWRFNPLYPRD
jgi:hypothetical protein